MNIDEAHPSIQRAFAEGRIVVHGGPRLSSGPKPLPTRKSKYRAVPVVIGGIRFDSKREGERYKVLSTWEKCSIISNLQTQVAFRIEVNGLLVCKYIADFVYERDGVQVVEDVKGVKTPVYRLKKKLMKAIHGIEVLES